MFVPTLYHVTRRQVMTRKQNSRWQKYNFKAFNCKTRGTITEGGSQQEKVIKIQNRARGEQSYKKCRTYTKLGRSRTRLLRKQHGRQTTIWQRQRANAEAIRWVKAGDEGEEAGEHKEGGRQYLGRHQRRRNEGRWGKIKTKCKSVTASGFI